MIVMNEWKLDRTRNLGTDTQDTKKLTLGSKTCQLFRVALWQVLFTRFNALRIGKEEAFSINLLIKR